MTENTQAADEIGDWLKTQPDFSEESVLVIHTNRRGEISEAASKARELDELREASRKVDEPDTPYRAIVSVLMLREGWDVRNVCVIVPLRAYSAKAQILPEQTLGRGLRRMWPVASGDVNEQVIVVDHESFHGFWDQELKEEGLDIERRPVASVHPEIETILVDPEKLEFDIAIPVLTPAITLETPDFGALDVSALAAGNLNLDDEAGKPLDYTGRDILTTEVVEKSEIERAFPADAAGYLNVLARLVLRECRLANLADGFAKLAPLMKRYVETRMFTEEASMDERRVMVRLNAGDAKQLLFRRFVVAIRALAIVEREVESTGERIRVSETKPYATTRRLKVEADRTVFNLVPCDSELEKRFAEWLDARADDVLAFAKNEHAVGFHVPYMSPSGGLRYYWPDFVVRTADAAYVVETKGLETIEVPRKDQRMAAWCRAASYLTGADWRYLKVKETLLDFSEWESLAELERGVRTLDP